MRSMIVFHHKGVPWYQVTPENVFSFGGSPFWQEGTLVLGKLLGVLARGC